MSLYDLRDNNFFRLICCVLIFTTVISFIPNVAYAANSKLSECPTFNDGTLILDESTVETLLLIENIPDKVIQESSKSINQYFEENGRPDLRSYDRIRVKKGAVGCIAAVGGAIAVNLTPAKILKVKSALKAVGGTVKFINKTVGLYNKYKATKSKLLAAKLAIENATKNISGREVLIGLFSLGGVYSECFE